jgi:hypothetical protein
VQRTSAKKFWQQHLNGSANWEGGAPKGPHKVDFLGSYLQNLGIMIGWKDKTNHTTAKHIIAAIRAITTNKRSPFDMAL